MDEVIGDQEESVADLIPLEKLAEKLKEQGAEPRPLVRILRELFGK